jgi:uncharacterized membrane protein YbhN (UPF0104 family)
MSMNKLSSTKTRSIALVVFGVALIYLVWAFAQYSQDIVAALSEVSLAKFILATACGLGMIFSAGLYQVLLLESFSETKLDRKKALSAYFQSQLIRYLPGKIWGVIYQGRLLSNQSSMQLVVFVNLLQLMTTQWLMIGIVLALVFFEYMGQLSCIVIFLFFVVATELFHRFTAIQSYVLARVVLFASKLGLRLGNFERKPISVIATLLLLLEWFFYCLVFLVLFSDEMTLGALLKVSVWYAAASAIALFFWVIPSGLGVREAVFVALAPELIASVAEFFAWSIVLRIVFLLSEFLLASLMLIWERQYER